MQTIGILGGGQLAAFLAREAIAESMNVVVLDEALDCPARLAGARVLKGSPMSESDIRRLSGMCDVLTIDREEVNVDALLALESEGTHMVPSARALKQMTDKLSQKRCLAENGIPTASFCPFDSRQDKLHSPFGWPVVQKLARGGYDGRGVSVLSDPSSLSVLDGEGYLEAWVERKSELSVIVVRGGETCVTYPVVEMTFNDDNTLEYLVSPGRISEVLAQKAKQLAVAAVESFGSDGIFGVEMFLTDNDELLVNEIAPRTHNSGHHTLDASAVSQFRQQLRLLKGLEPADPGEATPAVMFNLLGIGKPDVELGDELEEAIHMHWYGKNHCFPGRKMGHVTVLGESVEDALDKAMLVRRHIYREATERDAA